jgi:hypothetical protein
VSIRGPKEKIESFQKFLDDNNGKDWFDFFHPCPQELKDVGNVPFNEAGNAELAEKYGYSDWYSWSVDNWGTKWNCDAQDWSSDGESITFWFDSAWSPPIALYSFIEQGGDFEVVGDYLEEGMQFVGRYSDGFDDSYEYSDIESLDDIPEEIVEEWDLRTRMEEWEEMLDEDEE